MDRCWNDQGTTRVSQFMIGKLIKCFQSFKLFGYNWMQKEARPTLNKVEYDMFMLFQILNWRA